MALDMNGLLPGTDGGSSKTRRRSRFLRIILLAVAFGAIGVVGYLKIYPRLTALVNDFRNKQKQEATVELGLGVGEDLLPEITAASAPKPLMPVVPKLGNKSSQKLPAGKEVATVGVSQRPAPLIRKQWQQVAELENMGEIRKLEALLKQIYRQQKTNAHGATALLRLGLLARKQGNIEVEQKFLGQAYSGHTATIAGRVAALMLADIWYKEFCQGDIPQYDKWEAIRDAYSVALGTDRATFIKADIQKRVLIRLRVLNKRLVFSRYPCKGAVFHIVSRNDRLSIIARKYGVHYDGIATVNGIRSPQYFIRPGEKLKILKLPVFVLIDKKYFYLRLYLGGKFVKQYPICHGGSRTIPGSYTILTKSANPSWTDPLTKQVYKNNHKKNILGARWLGFANIGPGQGLGIHGTTRPHTIPGSSSNGCIRMYNKDVEEIYGLVLIGAAVRIRE